MGHSVSRENTGKCLEGSSDIFGSLRKSSEIIEIVGIKWSKTP